MNFDTSCLLTPGMAYEPPGFPNWYGGSAPGSYPHYQPSREPFGFPFGQQARSAAMFSDFSSSMQPFGLRDVGCCPPSMPSAFHTSNNSNSNSSSDLLRNGHHGNSSMNFIAKDSPCPTSSNDSPRYYGDPMRHQAASSGSHNSVDCLRSDAPQSVQYAGHVNDMEAVQKAVPAPTTPASDSNVSNVAKKKRDRFNGMSEEEVLKLTIPDQLYHNLDILIIGISPGMTAAYLGHHYAGPGNHFWKCLYLSGLIPEPMNASDDYRLKDFGIGFTNFVSRCSKGSVELSRREVKDGTEILTKKIQKYRPKIAVFNGKGIYELFCNHKNFYIGKQPEPFPGTDTIIYVMPSSSARCSQLPRASDKVPFFVALRKLRDHVCGRLGRPLDESEVVFPDLDLKVEPRRNRQQTTTTASTSSAPAPSISSSASDHQERKRPRSEDCLSSPGMLPAAAKLPTEIHPHPPISWQHPSLDPHHNWYPPPAYPPSLPDFDYIGSRSNAVAAAAAAASASSGYRSGFTGAGASLARTDFGGRLPMSDYMPGATAAAAAHHAASALHDRFGLADPAGILPKFPYSNINPYSYEATMPGYGVGNAMPSSFSLPDNFWPL